MHYMPICFLKDILISEMLRYRECLRVKDGVRDVCVCLLFSCDPLFVTLWTVACQALLSMGFFRQEYWSGLSGSPPEDLPNSGIEPGSLNVSCIAGGFFAI